MNATYDSERNISSFYANGAPNSERISQVSEPTARVILIVRLLINFKLFRNSFGR